MRESSIGALLSVIVFVLLRAMQLAPGRVMSKDIPGNSFMALPKA